MVEVMVQVLMEVQVVEEDGLVVEVQEILHQ